MVAAVSVVQGRCDSHRRVEGDPDRADRLVSTWFGTRISQRALVVTGRKPLPEVLTSGR